ncbi:hypothetical protein CQW23_02018 [Capsicum baccatum]|uniref:Uncharacterized protein n=1 Tax=Capsicum baccatum TaxID=33114 RepID=A0A2G2XQ80_CAPBA|nr:hypothetical protein CQW23_02018 [Capsicum baccatum]
MHIMLKGNDDDDDNDDVMHEAVAQPPYTPTELCSQGATDAPIDPMEKYEKEALYSAIQAFVGIEWNGLCIYSNPYG